MEDDLVGNLRCDAAELPDRILKAGGADQLCFGGSVLFIRAGETLFRMGGSGGDLSAAEISRDTLAILPVNGDEVFVCTPAYANRLDKEDFASG